MEVFIKGHCVNFFLIDPALFNDTYNNDHKTKNVVTSDPTAVLLLSTDSITLKK